MQLPEASIGLYHFCAHLCHVVPGTQLRLGIRGYSHLADAKDALWAVRQDEARLAALVDDEVRPFQHVAGRIRLEPDLYRLVAAVDRDAVSQNVWLAATDG